MTPILPPMLAGAGAASLFFLLSFRGLDRLYDLGGAPLKGDAGDNRFGPAPGTAQTAASGRAAGGAACGLITRSGLAFQGAREATPALFCCVAVCSI